MKKLSKLNISPQKVMKNDELLNLRGGGYPLDGCPEGKIQYKCWCTEGSALWIGCYTDIYDAKDDGNNYCYQFTECVRLS